MVSYKALNTPIKCPITYTSHTSRDDNVRQRTTIIKCPITYASHTSRDENARQRTTTKKCPFLNACYTSRDNYVRQRTTSTKASFNSSFVVSVDKSSFITGVILGFSPINNLKEHAESSFLANASMKRE